MKHIWTCDDVQKEMTAYIEGWLSDEDETSLRSHIDACDECQREMAKESRLVAALAELPAVSAPVIWAGSRAAKPRLGTGWRLAPLVGLAAFAVYFVTLNGQQAPATHPNPVSPVARNSSDDESFTKAHMLLSTSDLGSDPNRAMVLAARSDSGRNQ